MPNRSSLAYTGRISRVGKEKHPAARATGVPVARETPSASRAP